MPHDLKHYLIYVDPPYLKTKSDYALSFSKTDMQVLATQCNQAVSQGATVVVSNNDEGAKCFQDYIRYDKEFLYSVNPKCVKGCKKNEVILVKTPEYYE